MERRSPIFDLHEQYVNGLAVSSAGVSTAEADRPNAATGRRDATAGPELIPYGLAQTEQDEQRDPVEIVGAFDVLETEYATLRRGAGIMDWPQRGTVVVEGADRRDFLNRLLTQQLIDLEDGLARQSFLISRKGRIMADLLVTEVGGRILIDVDIYQAKATADALNEFVFSEDVQIRDATDEKYQLAMHGPAAGDVLAVLTGDESLRSFEELRSKTVEIAGKNVVVVRRDQVGEPGFAIFVRRDDARDVWQAMLNLAQSATAKDKPSVRPVGWFAWNIARIETGTLMMNIDFDTTCLPHESSVVTERVSFRKGCYPGQEIVARMENLGQPKQRLYGLRITGEALPEAGSDIYPKPAEGEGNFDDPIGVITSSTLSPMLSAQAIAFAMLRTKDIKEGSVVMVMAEGVVTEATVGPVKFWSRQEHH